MAKKPAKETSLPLVFSLVFFVLTTIAFGVMWYTQYSDQQAKDKAVDDAKKDATAAQKEATEAKLDSRIYRIYLGIEEDKDKESVASETKGKAKVDAAVKKLNDAMIKAYGVEDYSKLPDELKIWNLDDKGSAAEPPAKGFLPIVGMAVKEREEAIKDKKKAVEDYTKAVADIKKAITEIAEGKKTFADVAAALPKDFDQKIKAIAKTYDDRKAQFQKNEAQSRDELIKTEDEKQKAERERGRLQTKIKDIQKELDDRVKELMKKQDTFQYDEPQGKILQRLASGVVEINLGSDVLVRPGLTFTVLPNDYPEKGRQSRIRRIRMPNDKGEYKDVERFVEKATIEVIEVLGPKLSRARITSEYEPIRDAVGPGDLLYNSAWRKGTADHIALIGVFDINGDGTDDIETVVRDLQKMGIPVDAYYDLKTRQWKGQIDAQTRFIIQGYSPVTERGNDPRIEEKSKLINSISDGIKFAQSKGGAQVVNFRDFFPRMGYKIKLDVSADKINQASAPYLQNVSAVETPGSP